MSKLCNNIHTIINQLPRYSFPFFDGEIPNNGIYVLFEKGEKAHDVDRIVRIGTHNVRNQLKSRLKWQFINEDKDKSNFRKNIGSCLLKAEQNPYLKVWEKDLISRRNKKLYGHLVNKKLQRTIERKVTDILQEGFSFSIIKLDEKEDRVKIGTGLIAAISLCEACSPSDQWLGLNSPKKKIRESGLWQDNHLYKTPLTFEGLELLKHAVKNSLGMW